MKLVKRQHWYRTWEPVVLDRKTLRRRASRRRWFRREW